MEEVLKLPRGKDMKEMMAGVKCLHRLSKVPKKNLISLEVASHIDCCIDFLKDNNLKVSQGTPQSLAFATMLSGEHFKIHFNALVLVVVDRLGDAKQPIRDATRRLLLTLMEVLLSIIACSKKSCDFS
ncbi:hypothetical protein L6164_002017 [Bauhinia variegata]|uniref:Uncharacterized protein n=1 Tax=Bauhinia variegata TaxID=167791 RepID=A0ACB9PW25_BAUVA|nr:hypothetical protein L6164_002017 [Bauhinia variegata]